MTDHPRLPRYIPTCVGTAYAGMSKESKPGVYGPEQDPNHGPYVLAAEADAEIDRLMQWVSDLQSGMYVNCVYCGHRYGPGETTPVSMADALRAHVEACPKHPMSALKAECDRLRAENARFRKLYHLLARDVIFFSQYDEDTNTWPDCGEFFSPCVLLNDTFAYATADAERVTDDQLDTLITVERQFGNDGVVAWAAQVRGSEPLEPYRTEKYRAAREWLRTSATKPPAPQS